MIPYHLQKTSLHKCFIEGGGIIAMGWDKFENYSDTELLIHNYLVSLALLGENIRNNILHIQSRANFQVTAELTSCRLP